MNVLKIKELGDDLTITIMDDGYALLTQDDQRMSIAYSQILKMKELWEEKEIELN